MNGATMLSNVLALVARWAGLVPGMLRHDPLFRYAAIAAALALFFLIARVTQDIAGPGAIPPAEQDTVSPVTSDRVGKDVASPGDRSATSAEPPVPGSATAPKPEDASPPILVPGRSLEGIEVEPTAPDSFGTLPQGEREE